MKNKPYYRLIFEYSPIFGLSWYLKKFTPKNRHGKTNNRKT